MGLFALQRLLRRRPGDRETNDCPTADAWRGTVRRARYLGDDLQFMPLRRRDLPYYDSQYRYDQSPEFKFRFVFFRLQMLRFSALSGPNEQKFGELLT